MVAEPAAPLESPPPSAEGPSPWYAAEDRTWIPVVAALHALAFLAPGLYIASSFLDYFTHYHCDRLDLVIYLGVLMVAPLAALGLLRLLLPPRLAELFTVAVGVVLGTVFASHALALATGLSVIASGVAGLAVAGVGLALLGRWPSARPVQALGLLVFLAPALVFVQSTGIMSRLGRELPPPAAGPPATKIPVLFLVLDEFPVTSIMDGTGALDRDLYPGLAAVAEASTWYPNTTTVHSYTKGAVPALLTGRYPDEARIPIAQEFPQNLLRLLSPHMPVVAFEGGSDLYERSRGVNVGAYRSRWNRQVALLRDARSMVGALLLPDPSGTRVLEVARSFDFFLHGEMRAGQARGVGFGGLAAEVRKPVAPGQGLYYLHTTLPHGPYHYAPGGGIYAPYDPAPLSLVPRPTHDGGRVPVVLWGDDEWLVAHAYQRHLLQAMCTDALLARLWKEWRARPDFDQSMVIVTSDHGNLFAPGEMARYLGQEDPRNLAEILGVPLFIKYPGQREGRIDPRPAEVVDIVPTIARAMGLELPVPADGLALQDAAPPTRTRRAYDVDQREVTHEVTLEQLRTAAATRRTWFDHRPEDPMPWPYRLEPVGHLVGRPVPEAPGAEVPVRLKLMPDRPAGRAGLEGLLGELQVLDPELQGKPVFLAASHQGRVVGVTRLVDHGPGWRTFLILFPPRPGTRPADYTLWVTTPEGRFRKIRPQG